MKIVGIFATPENIKEEPKIKSDFATEMMWAMCRNFREILPNDNDEHVPLIQLQNPLYLGYL